MYPPLIVPEFSCTDEHKALASRLVALGQQSRAKGIKAIVQVGGCQSVQRSPGKSTPSLGNAQMPPWTSPSRTTRPVCARVQVATESSALSADLRSLVTAGAFGSLRSPMMRKRGHGDKLPLSGLSAGGEEGDDPYPPFRKRGRQISFSDTLEDQEGKEGEVRAVLHFAVPCDGGTHPRPGCLVWVSVPMHLCGVVCKASLATCSAPRTPPPPPFPTCCDC